MADVLTNRQQAALAALLTNPTRAAAARACGLSEKTLWMYEHQNAEFQQALADARAGVIQQAAQSLGTCYPRAVEVLRQLMDDPKQAASVRVSAARALLEFGLRYAEAADFDRRLRDLEGVLEE